jgi:hypothetical protein
LGEIQVLQVFFRLGPLFQIIGIGLYAYWVTWGGGRHYSMGTITLLFFLTVIVASAVGLGFSFLAQRLVHHLGGGLVNVMMGLRSIRSVREQRSGDVERIRYYSRSREFGQALELADDILEKDEGHPEVLALRAQVLWEGYQDAVRAREDLHRLIEDTPQDDPHHRWAVQYWRRIGPGTGEKDADPAAPSSPTRPVDKKAGS